MNYTSALERLGGNNAGVESFADFGVRQITDCLRYQARSQVAIWREIARCYAADCWMAGQIHRIGDQGRSGIGKRGIAGNNCY